MRLSFTRYIYRVLYGKKPSQYHPFTPIISFEFSVFPNPVKRGQLSIQVTGADVERHAI